MAVLIVRVLLAVLKIRCGEKNSASLTRTVFSNFKQGMETGEDGRAAGYQQKTFLGRKRLAAPGAEQLFPAHDIVPFDHRGDSQPITLIFLTALDPHYFAGGSYQHGGTPRNFAGQGQGNVQLRAGLQILVDYKIKATGRDIARFAIWQ